MAVFIDKNGRKWPLPSRATHAFYDTRRGVCGICEAMVEDIEPAAPKPYWWHPPHPSCPNAEKHLLSAQVQPFRMKRQRRQVERAGKKARKMRR